MLHWNRPYYSNEKKEYELSVVLCCQKQVTSLSTHPERGSPAKTSIIEGRFQKLTTTVRKSECEGLLFLI